MMKTSVVLVLCMCAIALAWPVHFNVDSVVHGDGGKIAWVRGDLGVFGSIDQYMAEVASDLGLSGTEKFAVARKEVDSTGAMHLFLQEYIRGLEVDGGEIGIHFDEATGEVFALGVNVIGDHEDAHYNDYVFVEFVDAREVISEHYSDRADFNFVDEPELIYLAHEGEGYIAYRAHVEYTEEGAGHQGRFHAFFCPRSGEYIVEFPLFFPALERAIYDMQNSDDQDDLPGKQVRTEGAPATGDSEVDNAYDNAGVCYDFYKQKFDRDSFDNKGAPMLSSVHFGVNYNNAFWNGSQMVYGDGDGEVFENFSSDLSVVCHELTHAVVQYTAGLRYFKESGALNEGFADIFGSSADIFNHTETIFPQQWQIGYETYVAGPALRYMNNPTLDGKSYDYYPERYMGLQDVGGVHSNSGIANLAYVLSVQGGVHPRQKTTHWVQGLGLNNAEQVFYSALSNYMMRTTNFAGARVATEVAADKLYGPAASYDVSLAWAAVGVGAVPPQPSSS